MENRINKNTIRYMAGCAWDEYSQKNAEWDEGFNMYLPHIVEEEDIPDLIKLCIKTMEKNEHIFSKPEYNKLLYSKINDIYLTYFILNELKFVTGYIMGDFDNEDIEVKRKNALDSLLEIRRYLEAIK